MLEANNSYFIDDTKPMPGLVTSDKKYIDKKIFYAY